MTKALLYSPKDRWQIWAAFGGAALIHLAAIALAETPANNQPGPVAVEPVIDVEFSPPTELPTPPPEMEELSVLVPPPPPDQIFIEEHSTPPTLHPAVDRQVHPIAKAAVIGLARPSTMGAAKVFAISAPRPDYPYEARRQRATGSGVAVLTVDPATGYVTDVSMSQTTGNAILDSATVSAFRRWRFRPGTVATVRTPITFLLTGATY